MRSLINLISHLRNKYPCYYLLLFLVFAYNFTKFLMNEDKILFKYIELDYNQQLTEPYRLENYFSDLRKVREKYNCKERVFLFSNISPSRFSKLFILDRLDYPVVGRYIFSPCFVEFNPFYKSDESADLILYHESSPEFRKVTKTSQGEIIGSFFVVQGGLK